MLPTEVIQEIERLQKPVDANTDLPTELFEEMLQIAIDTDRSLSAVYRVALRNYIASRYQDEVSENV